MLFFFFIFALKPYQARRRQKKSYNVRGSERFPSTPDGGKKKKENIHSTSGWEQNSLITLHLHVFVALRVGRRFHAFQTNATEPHYSSIAPLPFQQHRLDVFNRGGGGTTQQQHKGAIIAALSSVEAANEKVSTRSTSSCVWGAAFT